MFKTSLINLQRVVLVAMMAAFLACSPGDDRESIPEVVTQPVAKVADITPTAKPVSTTPTASPTEKKQEQQQEETKKELSDNLRATIETSHGNIVIKFYAEDSKSIPHYR